MSIGTIGKREHEGGGEGKGRKEGIEKIKFLTSKVN